MGVTKVDMPVDIRVPPLSLQFVKTFLESNGIEYSVMIEDLQVRHRRTIWILKASLNRENLNLLGLSFSDV